MNIHEVESISYDNLVDNVEPGDILICKEKLIVSWPPDGLSKFTLSGVPTFGTITNDLMFVIGVSKFYVEHSNYNRIDIIIMSDSKYWWFRKGNQ